MIIKNNSSSGVLFEVLHQNQLRVRSSALVIQGNRVHEISAGTIAEGIADTVGDHVVEIRDDGALKLRPVRPGESVAGDVVGGCYFAPGGCALAYTGGDSQPQFNPFSAWDRIWRPAASAPYGMTLVEGRFWEDINFYSEADGSIINCSCLDATVAATARGKRLPTAAEFELGAIGVTEHSAAGHVVRCVTLDAPRTSRWGVMQATGNLWTWLALRVDPTISICAADLRAGLAGAHWNGGANAGSRAADWNNAPSNSFNSIGARFLCDHLALS